MKMLSYTVFPSEEKTLFVDEDPIYGGAHLFGIKNSLGFNDGRAIYDDSYSEVRFIEKKDNGVIIPGIQSEQLAYILLDRCIKLNSRFPSPHNEKMILGLNIFLEACRERVEERINAGVMGQLKNIPNETKNEGILGSQKQGDAEAPGEVQAADKDPAEALVETV